MYKVSLFFCYGIDYCKVCAIVRLCLSSLIHRLKTNQKLTNCSGVSHLD